MKKHIFGLAALAFALPLAGCSSPSLPVDGASDKPLASRLGDSIDLSLADLLTKPRQQLAEMADECAKRIDIQEKSRREGRLPFTLIPSLHLPLAVPVLREAHYSAKAGFSLPPYLAEGSKDSALALHLARHGDSTAANTLVEPGDAETGQQIKAARCQREYPVEWTRLVGLLLHAAQIRLATGDVEGGTELVVLHRQLRAVLDPQAAKGTLGAVLLARGRETLARAAAAWRAGKRLELAAQADAALAEWGEVPALTIPFPTGTPRAQINRLLMAGAARRRVGEGRALLAPSTARAFDLLALPFPDAGAEAVVISFDDADRLADVLITYRTGFGESFPDPTQLALLIEDGPLHGEEGPTAAGLRSHIYRLGALACVVAVVDHGAGIGAFVRLSSAKEGRSTLNLPRDFGGAHLDRTFEQNRVRLALEKRAETALTIASKAALAQLRNPLPELHLTQAELRREKKEQNVAASLVLRYPVDNGGPPALHKLALPLWVAFGPGQFQGVSDKNGGHLALIWEDARTRYTLRSPYDVVQPVELEISDRQGPGHLAEREAAAVALDQRERAQRLKAGKPLARIARQLEQIELGMNRKQALQLLPSGQAVLKRDMPGGLAVTFRGEPATTEAYVVRQMFIRFDKEGRVLELRARYMDGPSAGATAQWMSELLKKIKKRSGAPREEPSPWERVWIGLPEQKPAPLLCRWYDDITVLVYQRDAAGVELALRDCSADPEAGRPLPPLEYLPRGPANLQLGAQRQQLLQKWGIADPVTTEDGALVLRPAGANPFDVFLVEFDNDHVVRIVARHASMGANLANPMQWGRALADAWGRELATLGWPRRQDLAANDIVQSLGWHDDRTRVRIFWQEADTPGPPHLFTEWKELAPRQDDKATR